MENKTQSWSGLLIEIDETRERIANINKQLEYFQKEKSEQMDHLEKIKKRATGMKNEAQAKAQKLELELNGLASAIQKIEDYTNEE